MVSSLVHTFCVAAIFFLNIELCICTCGQDEYEINGEYCHMCLPGNLNYVNGLRVKTKCTWTSDTVCEPLEGFYCTDEHRGSCRYTMEHKKCSPGEYIKQKG
ncbi:hypothetical protein QTP70_021772 [Hemibagrus guttatus]|uniref:TNFR-Cys domain-containing protein n=1 Tax=Hemibagrus guttatus TaxID=175788 RepID=A0AAE0PP97_9TELE|nr:hypothetical protein QTP70_021772 [Hemibagrus guttatus]